MRGTRQEGVANSMIGLTGTALGRFLPMHLCLDPVGRVRQAGPTLERIAGVDLVDRPFTEILTLRRPTVVSDIGGLLALEGRPLKLTLAVAPALPLKGLVAGLPDGGAMLDISMGISLIEAVSRFELTLGDFSPTDLAVELLYLHEAKSVVSAELRRLAQRLNGARVSAEQEAATDTLTGLANRRRLEATLARLLGQGRPFALMQIDLDYFKLVNDSHGHDVGDAVLREVAHLLRAQCRTQDLVARIGGDEFVMILADIVEPFHLARIADRLIRQIEEPIHVGGFECRISASIGVAVRARQDASDAKRIMREADIALYQSKGTGRARVTVFSPTADATGDPDAA
ncbi:GGDEF domain-containing protein [Rhodovulum steppense]|uniref:Diguanylate cyclase (GGDEF)-like protein n=1 Tax=Rhodovulum steppense TaxID=540251 RepID=A0A4R1YY49_9RHOB|nr:GGDEF domain-containing protein [Rhodovulum steppense]TCM86160.1 diguanylate cyclase (GGDEF)-like protein [Rhodovulum steppense]